MGDHLTKEKKLQKKKNYSDTRSFINPVLKKEIGKYDSLSIP